MFPHAAGKFGSPADAQTSPGSRLETFSAVAILKNPALIPSPKHPVLTQLPRQRLWRTMSLVVFAAASWPAQACGTAFEVSWRRTVCTELAEVLSAAAT